MVGPYTTLLDATGVKSSYLKLVSAQHNRALLLDTTRSSAPTTTQPRRTLKVFLAGLDSGGSLNAAAEQLGDALAQLPIRVIYRSMASEICQRVGYAIAEQAERSGTYRPDTYTLCRRTTSLRAKPISRPLGRTEYYPGSLHSTRGAILADSDIVIALPGDAGTSDEVRMADSLGMPVVPLAAAGGTARALWYAHSPLWEQQPQSVRATHARLASTDMTVATHATALLIDHFAHEHMR